MQKRFLSGPWGYIFNGKNSLRKIQGIHWHNVSLLKYYEEHWARCRDAWGKVMQQPRLSGFP
jgi:hypothetical protein